MWKLKPYKADRTTQLWGHSMSASAQIYTQLHSLHLTFKFWIHWDKVVSHSRYRSACWEMFPNLSLSLTLPSTCLFLALQSQAVFSSAQSHFPHAHTHTHTQDANSKFNFLSVTSHLSSQSSVYDHWRHCHIAGWSPHSESLTWSRNDFNIIMN